MSVMAGDFNLSPEGGCPILLQEPMISDGRSTSNSYFAEFHPYEVCTYKAGYARWSRIVGSMVEVPSALPNHVNFLASLRTGQTGSLPGFPDLCCPSGRTPLGILKPLFNTSNRLSDHSPVFSSRRPPQIKNNAILR